jgi:uncharacterized protein
VGGEIFELSFYPMRIVGNLMRKAGALFFVALNLFISTAHATPPANPTNFVATATSPRDIHLSWVDNATDETGYVISQGSAAGSYNFVGWYPVPDLQSFDTGACPGVTKYFKLQAYKRYADRTYEYSAALTTSVTPPNAVPLTPEEFQAFPISATQIRASLGNGGIPCGVDGWKIQRSTSPTSGFVTVGTISTIMYFDDTPPAVKTVYYYRAIAYNVMGDSIPTAAVAASIDRPATPTDLTAVESGTKTQISLAWNNSSFNAEGYTLERSTSAFFSPTTVVVTKTTGYTTGYNWYTDTPPTPNTIYYYRVKSFNSLGTSDYSAPAQVTFGTINTTTPLPPVNVRVIP